MLRLQVKKEKFKICSLRFTFSTSLRNLPMDVPIPLARLDLEKQDSDEPAIETSTSIQDEARGPEAEPQSVQHSLQSRDPVQDGDDNEARIEFTDDNEAEPDRQASIRDVLREEHSQQAASGSTKAAIRSHRNFPDPSYPSFTLPIARRRKREPGIEYIDWHEDDRQNPFHWRKSESIKFEIFTSNSPSLSTV